MNMCENMNKYLKKYQWNNQIIVRKISLKCWTKMNKLSYKIAVKYF